MRVFSRSVSNRPSRRRPMSRLGLCAAVGLLVLLLPLGASGQVEVSARAARITLGGTFNPQFAASSVDTAPSRFFTRRARIRLDVRVGEFLEARVEPDFGGGTPTLQDAWGRIAFGPGFALSFGQFKRAFSVFELESSADLPIIERDGRIAGFDHCMHVGGVCSFSGILQRLKLDGRDVGVRVDGRVGGRLQYLATLTNGQGQNVPDINDAKSLSARFVFDATERVRLGFFGALHDHLDAASETAFAPAMGAHVELGTWRNGLHVLAAVAAGENWRAASEARFLTAQALASYYLPLNRPRVAGIEPLIRLSWGDPDRGVAGDAGFLLTSGAMIYFDGRNGVAFNLDSYTPGGGLDRAWSLKAQAYLYF